jgi:hypothetical protein
VTRPARLARALAAVVLLVAALSVHRLVLPGGAFACSCADPGAGPIFSGQEEAVFTGIVGMPDARGPYAFKVESWFKGGSDEQVLVNSERQVFPDGSTAINTCGLHFEVGDYLLLTAVLVEGVLTPGLCAPHAVVDSPEGQRLIAAATAVFGEPRAPGAPPGTGPTDAVFSFDLASIALLVIGAIVVLAVVVVLVAVIRGRRPEVDE